MRMKSQQQQHRCKCNFVLMNFSNAYLTHFALSCQQFDCYFIVIINFEQLKCWKGTHAQISQNAFDLKYFMLRPRIHKRTISKRNLKSLCRCVCVSRNKIRSSMYAFVLYLFSIFLEVFTNYIQSRFVWQLCRCKLAQ